jgi:vacuolar-type H+-ATPase subunit H
LEANTGVLRDLASREAALTQKVEAARTEAQRIIADAETKAAELVRKAQTDAAALEAEFKVRRDNEVKAISESGLSAARSTADAAKTAAQGRIADAVRVIVGKVLP